MPGVNYQLGLDASPALSALQGFKSMLGGVTGALALVGVSFGAFKGAGDFIDSLKGVFRAGKELGTLHAITGQSIQDVVALRKAFDEAGIGAEAVEGNVTRLQKALGGISEDGNKTGDAFARLGLDIEALKNLSAVEQLEKIGGAINGLGNQADRARVTTDIFGRAGAQMLAVFADTGGLARAAEETKVIGDIQARNAQTFARITNNLDALGGKVRGFFAGFGDQVAPVLDPLIAKLRSIDLTGLGEQVGGAVRILAAAFKDGQVANLVGLSVTAGMQMGANAGIAAFSQLSGHVSDALLQSVQTFHAAFNAAALTSGQFINSELNQAFTDPLKYFQQNWVQALLNPIGVLQQKLIESAMSFGKVLWESMKGNPAAAAGIGKAAQAALNPAGAAAALTVDFAQKMNAGRAGGGAPDFAANFQQQMAAIQGSYQAVAEGVRAALPKGDQINTKPAMDALGALVVKLSAVIPKAAEVQAAANKPGAENAPNTIAKAGEKIHPLTDRLAKIGGFIGGNGGVLGEQAQKDTASNTKRMVELQRTTNQHIDNLITVMRSQAAIF